MPAQNTLFSLLTSTSKKHCHTMISRLSTNLLVPSCMAKNILPLFLTNMTTYNLEFQYAFPTVKQLLYQKLKKVVRIIFLLNHKIHLKITVL